MSRVIPWARLCCQQGSPCTTVVCNPPCSALTLPVAAQLHQHIWVHGTSGDPKSYNPPWRRLPPTAPVTGFGLQGEPPGMADMGGRTSMVTPAGVLGSPSLANPQSSFTNCPHGLGQPVVVVRCCKAACWDGDGKQHSTGCLWSLLQPPALPLTHFHAPHCATACDCSLNPSAAGPSTASAGPAQWLLCVGCWRQLALALLRPLDTPRQRHPEHGTTGSQAGLALQSSSMAPLLLSVHLPLCPVPAALAHGVHSWWCAESRRAPCGDQVPQQRRRMLTARGPDGWGHGDTARLPGS